MTIKQRLEQAHPGVFTLYAILAAFITYASMHALRRPFTAAMYEGLYLFGTEYKIILIITQILGYATAKFIGIKLIAELKPESRPRLIFLFMGVALLSLLLFGLHPFPYGFIFLYFNGLPLGFLWGIVFSYLEGRRQTELLGAGLCSSFVIASGVAKTLGRVMIDQFGVSEFWMPFFTGLLCIPLLVGGTLLLHQVPDPTAADIEHRAVRPPMSRADRVRLVRLTGPGLVMLVLIYMGLSLFRDVRDNYAVEIWNELGFLDKPAILTYTEVVVALGVLLIISLMILIRNNRRGFYTNYILFIGGAGLILLVTFMQERGLIHPVWWMILAGFGMYISYIAFNTFLFDRLIALFRFRSNYGFLMYIADSFGYLGSIAILFYRNFGQADLSWLEFFRLVSYAVGVAVIFLSLLSWWFFFSREQRIKGRVGD